MEYTVLGEDTLSSDYCLLLGSNKAKCMFWGPPLILHAVEGSLFISDHGSQGLSRSWTELALPCHSFILSPCLPFSPTGLQKKNVHPGKSWVPQQDEESWCTKRTQWLTPGVTTFSNDILTYMIASLLGFKNCSHIPSHINLFTIKEKIIRFRWKIWTTDLWLDIISLNIYASS